MPRTGRRPAVTRPQLARAVALAGAIAGLPALFLQENSITRTSNYNTGGDELTPWSPPAAPGHAYTLSVNVTARDATSADETYTFKVQESADASAWTDASAAVAVTGTGVTAVGAHIRQPFVRLSLTVGGTTPSISFTARLAPTYA